MDSAPLPPADPDAANPDAARRRRVLATGFSSAAALAGACAYLYLANPHNPSLPVFACPFKALTGLDCPGCGGQRMVYDLLHGDLAGAAHNNLFLLVVLPALLAGGAWALYKRWHGRALRFPVRAVVVLALAGLAWAVLRNLAWWPLTPT